MQKRVLIYLFIVTAVVFSFSYAQAALYFLPRYQGSIQKEREKTEISCENFGGVSKGANQVCSGRFERAGLVCYKSCECASGYKLSGEKCVLKTCSDYDYLASKDATKSCTEKTPRTGLTCYSCVACNTSVYKYKCSGDLNATKQSGTVCNSLYDKCSCVTNASWNATSGKCECNTNYKVSGTSCVLKTCSDYGYLASSDSTKSCTSKTPRTGLTCYSCTDCDSSYKYNCSSITNASSGSGSACGGKYQKCTCKSGYYWSSGSCVKSCTPLNCNSGSNCKDENGKAAACTMAGSVLEGVETYSSCASTNCDSEGYKSGYRATKCKTDKDGWTLTEGLCSCKVGEDYKYTSSDCANASCSLGCNDKYKFNSCNDGYKEQDTTGICPRPVSTDCVELGYVETSCFDGKITIKCPYDSSKCFCMS